MTTPITPAPGSFCAVFAPLLPLLSSAPLEEDDDPATRDHVAGCPWCQQELARYMAVDRALRQGYGEAAHEGVLPFPFDLDGDEDYAEDYAFILEDMLEETMAEGTHQQPSTTARSSRWGDRRRGPGPRATAIAGIAAALILAVIATTIYAQFAARRTVSPAATKTSGAFTKVALPGLNFNTPWGFTTAPDGSFWYSESSSHGVAIGRVTPDGTNTEFSIPTDGAVKHMYFEGLAVGSDGNIWMSGEEDRGKTFPAFLRRMTPAGAVTTIPMPADVSINKMIAGPDGALWFIGAKAINPDTSDPDRYRSLIGRITVDGQISTFVTLSQSNGGWIHDICFGPDHSIWYAWTSAFDVGTTVIGRIGKVSLSGEVQEFAVPYPPGTIATGADGALWYSEFNSSISGDASTWTRKGYIGHITTAGVVSESPVDPSVSIGTVASGSDGAIWYPASGDPAGVFGRITPNGEVKMFSTGGNAEIYLVTAVPGALWLLDARTDLWYYRLPG
jgi:virginiamycin B lyase